MGGDTTITGARGEGSADRSSQDELTPPGATDESKPIEFMEDFRSDLARLLKKDPEQIGRVRKVEGSPPRYSLVDVVVCITGKTPQHAKHALDEACGRDVDVCQNIAHIPLTDSTGRRKQRTPVADIQTVLRVIM